MEVRENAKFCSACGTAITPDVPTPPAAPSQPVTPVPPAQPVRPTQPVYTPPAPAPRVITESDLPSAFKPLGAWSYFWLQILFSIPIVGFICLIIFSFSENVNRRNFARSYWCALLVALLIILATILILLVIYLITGVGLSAMFEPGTQYYY